MFKRSAFYKYVSIILLLVFLHEQIGWSQEGRAVWSDLSPAGGLVSKSTLRGIDVPYDLGTVNTAFGNDSGEMIIHIQDAHASLSAQNSITEILDTVATKYDVKLIALEGSEGYINTSMIKSIPDEDAREAVARALMAEGRLSAGELFSITRDDDDVLLYGVENDSLYKKNLEMFKAVISERSILTGHTFNLIAQLEQLSEAVYSDELKELERISALRKKGKMAFSDYWKAIGRIAREKGLRPERSAQLTKLLETIEIEKTIDFSKADGQRKRLIDRLSSVISREDLEALVLKSLLFKESKISQSDFHAHLITLAESCSIDSSEYTELAKFSNYVAVYESIDILSLFSDIDWFESRVRESVFRSDEERGLYRLLEFTRLIDKLYKLELSNEGFEKIHNSAGAITAGEMGSFISSACREHGISPGSGYDVPFIFSGIEGAMDFYRTAQERDRAMLMNTLDNMKREGKSVAALVTGGYHTQGLTSLMRENGLAHIVIVPKFADNVERPYIAVLTNKEQPYRELIESGKYNLAVSPFCSDIGEDELIEIAAHWIPFAFDKDSDWTGAAEMWHKLYSERYYRDLEVSEERVRKTLHPDQVAEILGVGAFKGKGQLKVTRINNVTLRLSDGYHVKKGSVIMAREKSGEMAYFVLEPGESGVLGSPRVLSPSRACDILNVMERSGRIRSGEEKPAEGLLLRPASEYVLKRLRDDKELGYTVMAQIQGMWGVDEARVIRILRSKPELAGAFWDTEGEVMAEARLFARSILAKAAAVEKMVKRLNDDFLIRSKAQKYFLRFKDRDVETERMTAYLREATGEAILDEWMDIRALANALMAFTMKVRMGEQRAKDIIRTGYEYSYDKTLSHVWYMLEGMAHDKNIPIADIAKDFSGTEEDPKVILEIGGGEKHPVRDFFKDSDFAKQFLIPEDKAAPRRRTLNIDPVINTDESLGDFWGNVLKMEAIEKEQVDHIFCSNIFNKDCYETYEELNGEFWKEHFPGVEYTEKKHYEQTVRELYRVLKPGGRVYIMTDMDGSEPLFEILDYAGFELVFKGRRTTNYHVFRKPEEDSMPLSVRKMHAMEAIGNVRSLLEHELPIMERAFEAIPESGDLNESQRQAAGTLKNHAKDIDSAIRKEMYFFFAESVRNMLTDITVSRDLDVPNILAPLVLAVSQAADDGSIEQDEYEDISVTIRRLRKVADMLANVEMSDISFMENEMGKPYCDITSGERHDSAFAKPSWFKSPLYVFLAGLASVSLSHLFFNINIMQIVAFVSAGTVLSYFFGFAVVKHAILGRMDSQDPGDLLDKRYKEVDQKVLSKRVSKLFNLITEDLTKGKVKLPSFELDVVVINEQSPERYKQILGKNYAALDAESNELYIKGSLARAPDWLLSMVLTHEAAHYFTKSEFLANIFLLKNFTKALKYRVRLLPGNNIGRTGLGYGLSDAYSGKDMPILGMMKRIKKRMSDRTGSSTTGGLFGLSWGMIALIAVIWLMFADPNFLMEKESQDLQTVPQSQITEMSTDQDKTGEQEKIAAVTIKVDGEKASEAKKLTSEAYETLSKREKAFYSLSGIAIGSLLGCLIWMLGTGGWMRLKKRLDSRIKNPGNRSGKILSIFLLAFLTAAVSTAKQTGQVETSRDNQMTLDMWLVSETPEEAVPEVDPIDPVVAELLTKLTDDNLDVRLMAARALGNMKEPMAAKNLVELAKSEGAGAGKSARPEIISGDSQTPVDDNMYSGVSLIAAKIVVAGAVLLGLIPFGLMLFVSIFRGKADSRNIKKALILLVTALTAGALSSRMLLKQKAHTLDLKEHAEAVTIPQRAVVRALADIGGPEAEGYLISVSKDGLWPVRKHAVELLGECSGREVEPALEEALGDVNKDVREAAAKSLKKVRERNKGAEAAAPVGSNTIRRTGINPVAKILMIAFIGLVTALPGTMKAADMETGAITNNVVKMEKPDASESNMLYAWEMGVVTEEPKKVEVRAPVFTNFDEAISEFNEFTETSFTSMIRAGQINIVGAEKKEGARYFSGLFEEGEARERVKKVNRWLDENWYRVEGVLPEYIGKLRNGEVRRQEQQKALFLVKIRAPRTYNALEKKRTPVWKDVEVDGVGKVYFEDGTQTGEDPMIEVDRRYDGNYAGVASVIVYEGHFAQQVSQNRTSWYLGQSRTVTFMDLFRKTPSRTKFALKKHTSFTRSLLNVEPPEGEYFAQDLLVESVVSDISAGDIFLNLLVHVVNFAGLALVILSGVKVASKIRKRDKQRKESKIFSLGKKMMVSAASMKAELSERRAERKELRARSREEAAGKKRIKEQQKQELRIQAQAGKDKKASERELRERQIKEEKERAEDQAEADRQKKVLEEETEALEGEMDRVASTLAGMEAAIEEKRAELARIEETITARSKKSEAMAGEVASSEKMLEDKEGSVQRAAAEERELDKNIADKRNELDRLRGEEEEITNRLEKASADSLQMTRLKEDKDSEIDSLRAIKQKEIEGAEKNLTAIQAEVNVFQKELARLRKERDDEERALHAARSGKGDIEQEMRESRENLRARGLELERLEKRIEELGQKEEAVNSAQEAAASIDRDIEARLEESKRIAREVEALKAQEEELRASVDKLRKRRKIEEVAASEREEAGRELEMRMESSKAEVTEASEELAAVKARLEGLETEVEASLEARANVEEAIKSRRKELAEVQTDVNGLRQEEVRLKAETAEFSKRLESKQEALAEIEEDRARLSLEIEQKRAEIAAEEETLSGIRAEIEEVSKMFEETKAAKEAEITRVRAELERLKAEGQSTRESLDKEISDKRQELQKAFEGIATLRVSSKEEENEFDARISAHQTQLERLGEEIKAAREQAAEKKSLLEEEISSRIRQIELANEELSGISERIEAARVEFGNLERERAREERAAEGTASARQKVEEEITAKSEQLGELRAEIEKLRGEIVGVRAQINADIEKGKTELESIESEKQSLLREAEELKEKAEQERVQTERAIQVREAEEKAAEDAQAERQRLDNEIKAKQEVLDLITGQVESLKNEADESRQEIEEEIEAYKIEIKDMQEEITSLSARMENESLAEKELIGRIGDLNRQKEEALDQLRRVEDTMDNKKSELDHMTEEIALLNRRSEEARQELRVLIEQTGPAEVSRQEAIKLNNELGEEILVKKAELEGIREEIGKLKEEIVTIKSQLASDIEEGKTELKSIESEKQSLLREAEELKEKAEQERVQTERAIQVREAEEKAAEDAQAERQRLDNEIKAKQEVLDLITGQVESLKNEADESRQEIEEEIEAYKIEIKDMQEEITSLSARMENESLAEKELIGRIGDLNRQKEEALDQLRRVEDTMDNKKSELDHMTEEIALLNRRSEEARQELRVLIEQTGPAEVSRQEAIKLNNELGEEILVKKAELEGIREEIGKLKEEIVTIKSQLASDIEEGKTELKRIESEKQTLLKAAEELKEKAEQERVQTERAIQVREAEEKAAENAQAERQRLDNEIKAKQEVLDLITGQVESLKNEADEARREIGDEIESGKEELKTVQEEIMALRARVEKESMDEKGLIWSIGDLDKQREEALSQLQRMEDSMVHERSELDRMTMEIAALNRRAEEARRDLMGLLEQKEIQEEAYREAEELNRELGEQISAKKSELEKVAGEVNDLMERTREIKSRLDTELKEKREELGQLDKELTEKKEQLAVTEEKRAETEKAVDGLSVVSAQLDETIVRKREEIEELDGQIGGMALRISTMKEQLIAAETDGREKALEIQNEIEGMERELDETRNELTELRQKNTAEQGFIRENDNLLREGEKILDEKRASIERMQGQIEEMRARSEETDIQLTENIGNKWEELERVEKDIAELRESSETMSAEYEQKIEEKRSELRRITLDIEKSTEEHGKAVAANEKYEADSEEERNELDAVIEGKRQEIKDLENEIELIRSEGDKAKQSLDVSLNARRQELERASEELAGMKRDMEGSKQALEAELIFEKSKLGQMKREIEQLRVESEESERALNLEERVRAAREYSEGVITKHDLFIKKLFPMIPALSKGFSGLIEDHLETRSGGTARYLEIGENVEDGIAEAAGIIYGKQGLRTMALDRDMWVGEKPILGLELYLASAGIEEKPDIITSFLEVEELGDMQKTFEDLYNALEDGGILIAQYSAPFNKRADLENFTEDIYSLSGTLSDVTYGEAMDEFGSRYLLKVCLTKNSSDELDFTVFWENAPSKSMIFGKIREQQDSEEAAPKSVYTGPMPPVGGYRSSRPATIESLKDLAAPGKTLREYSITTAPWLEEIAFFALPMISGHLVFGLNSLWSVALVAAARGLFFYLHPGVRGRASPDRYNAPLKVALSGAVLSAIPLAVPAVAVYPLTFIFIASISQAFFHLQANIKALTAGRAPAAIGVVSAKDIQLQDTGFFKAWEELLQGRAPDVSRLTDDVRVQFDQTWEGREFLYNLDKMKMKSVYLLTELDEKEREAALYFTNKLVTILGIRQWTLDSFEDIHGVRAILRNLLVAVHEREDLPDNTKSVIRGVTYGISLLAFYMEQAVLASRIRSQFPDEVYDALRGEAKDFTVSPEGMDEEEYLRILEGINTYEHIFNEDVRRALEGKVLHKMDPEGSRMVAYGNDDLPFVVKVMKDGAVDEAGRPVYFDRDILPGVMLARKRLGGLAANVLDIEDIELNIDGETRVFTKALIQTRTVPLRQKMRQLALMNTPEAGKEVKRIIRMWWELQVKMWKSGVVDDDIKIADNYGYDEITGRVVIFDYSNIYADQKKFWSDDQYANILDAFRLSNAGSLDHVAGNLRAGQTYDFMGHDVLREHKVEIEGRGEDITVSVWPSGEEALKEEKFLPLNDPFIADSKSFARISRALEEILGHNEYFGSVFSEKTIADIFEVLEYDVIWLRAQRQMLQSGLREDPGSSEHAVMLFKMGIPEVLRREVLRYLRNKGFSAERVGRIDGHIGLDVVLKRWGKDSGLEFSVKDIKKAILRIRKEAGDPEEAAEEASEKAVKDAREALAACDGDKFEGWYEKIRKEYPYMKEVRELEFSLECLNRGIEMVIVKSSLSRKELMAEFNVDWDDELAGMDFQDLFKKHIIGLTNAMDAGEYTLRGKFIKPALGPDGEMSELYLLGQKLGIEHKIIGLIANGIHCPKKEELPKEIDDYLMPSAADEMLKAMEEATASSETDTVTVGIHADTFRYIKEEDIDRLREMPGIKVAIIESLDREKALEEVESARSNNGSIATVLVDTFTQSADIVERIEKFAKDMRGRVFMLAHPEVRSLDEKTITEIEGLPLLMKEISDKYLDGIASLEAERISALTYRGRVASAYKAFNEETGIEKVTADIPNKTEHYLIHYADGTDLKEDDKFWTMPVGTEITRRRELMKVSKDTDTKHDRFFVMAPENVKTDEEKEEFKDKIVALWMLEDVVDRDAIVILERKEDGYTSTELLGRLKNTSPEAKVHNSGIRCISGDIKYDNGDVLQVKLDARSKNSLNQYEIFVKLLVSSPEERAMLESGIDGLTRQGSGNLYIYLPQAEPVDLEKEVRKYQRYAIQVLIKA